MEDDDDEELVDAESGGKKRLWKDPKSGSGVREARPILTGKEGLDRVTEPREPDKRYRALLLFAMQDPDRRSAKLAASAVGFGESWAHKYSQAWAWRARVRREGPGAQAKAIRLYRQLFNDERATVEVALVERNMSVPSFPDGSPPNTETGVGDATRAHLEREKAKDPQNSAPNSVGGIARKLERFTGLMEAVIGGMGQQVYRAINSKDPGEFAKLGIKASDIPRFVREWVALQELQKQHAPAVDNGGVQLEPSFRVKQAKDRGDSLLNAHLLDAQETVAILTALASAEAGVITAPTATVQPKAGSRAVS